VGPKRNPTRRVPIGAVSIGGGEPIVIQSMTATRTTDIDATVAQVRALAAAGAGIVRIAADSRADAEALAEIRRQVDANLSVDLQEHYRLAEWIAPHVDKIRYNPGHLYHHERTKDWRDKVRYLVDVAGSHQCAMRVGVNCGSIEPERKSRFDPTDSLGPMLAGAWDHCEFLDSLGFTRYCVSLKDSDPAKVVELNRRFAERRADVPIHLGVTEAGLPPDAIVKTRRALEPLLGQGIGDTVRVSLTVPNPRKHEEIDAARAILADVAAGRTGWDPSAVGHRLNVISCPSCSRVENEAFVELAERVRDMTRYATPHAITIAVMGCRVNGPGETDDADLGLWCGPHAVNLKRGSLTLGSFPYDAILDRLRAELDRLIESRTVGSLGAEPGSK